MFSVIFVSTQDEANRVKKLRTSRRRFLKLAAGASVAFDLTGRVLAAEAAPTLSDQRISLEFDPEMRLRLVSLTGWSATDPLGHFVLKSHSKQEMRGQLGKGTRLHLIGESDSPRLQKTVVVELYRDYPGFALYQVTYRNLGTEP